MARDCGCRYLPGISFGRDRLAPSCGRDRWSDLRFHCLSKLSIETGGTIEMLEMRRVDEFNCPMVQVLRQRQLDPELTLLAVCR